MDKETSEGIPPVADLETKANQEIANKNFIDSLVGAQPDNRPPADISQVDVQEPGNTLPQTFRGTGKDTEFTLPSQPQAEISPRKLRDEQRRAEIRLKHGMKKVGRRGFVAGAAAAAVAVVYNADPVLNHVGKALDAIVSNVSDPENSARRPDGKLDPNTLNNSPGTTRFRP